MNDFYPLPGNPDPPAENGTTIEQLNDVLIRIGNGTTLQEMLGIPVEVMRGIYAHGYRLYQDGRYDDARLFFEFLCTHDMYNADYLLGLAAIHQQQKDYVKAISLYRLAFDLDGHCYRAMLYAGQCNLFLKERDNARICFGIVEHGNASDALKRQARAYLSGMPATDHSTTEGSAHV